MIRGRGWGHFLKEGEGIRQGKYMKDSQTCTTGLGLTVEVGGVLDGGVKVGNNWNNCKT